MLPAQLRFPGVMSMMSFQSVAAWPAFWKTPVDLTAAFVSTPTNCQSPPTSVSSCATTFVPSLLCE